MNWLKRRSEGFWWILTAAVVFVAGVIFMFCGGWDWLRYGTAESRGTTIRNAFLMIGGLDALRWTRKFGQVAK